MNHAECFDLSNNYGAFSVHELVTPGKEYSSDILAVTRADLDTMEHFQIIEWTSGASLMTEDEIMRFFLNAVAEWMAENVPQEELAEALKRFFKEPGVDYLEFEYER